MEYAQVFLSVSSFTFLYQITGLVGDRVYTVLMYNHLHHTLLTIHTIYIYLLLLLFCTVILAHYSNYLRTTCYCQLVFIIIKYVSLVGFVLA